MHVLTDPPPRDGGEVDRGRDCARAEPVRVHGREDRDFPRDDELLFVCEREGEFACAGGEGGRLVRRQGRVDRWHLRAGEQRAAPGAQGAEGHCEVRAQWDVEAGGEAPAASSRGEGGARVGGEAHLAHLPPPPLPGGDAAAASQAVERIQVQQPRDREAEPPKPPPYHPSKRSSGVGKSSKIPRRQRIQRSAQHPRRLRKRDRVRGIQKLPNHLDDLLGKAQQGRGLLLLVRAAALPIERNSFGDGRPNHARRSRSIAAKVTSGATSSLSAEARKRRVDQFGMALIPSKRSWRACFSGSVVVGSISAVGEGVALMVSLLEVGSG